MACLGDIDLVNKKLDLRVLVAPLKTVDSVVKKIPLVNHVLGGTLVSIPIKVEGDWGNPTVTPLSPSAVGSGLMGIMKRILELPFKIIEPLVPMGK
ncbi:MAG: AsmA-like C-terminal domain-containing protein, partial [Desulfobacteria bacterium]